MRKKVSEGRELHGEGDLETFSGSLAMHTRITPGGLAGGNSGEAVNKTQV